MEHSPTGATGTGRQCCARQQRAFRRKYRGRLGPAMSDRSWSRSPGVILGSLTTLNALNYLDRYVTAAILPLMLADLAIPDAQGGLLRSRARPPREVRSPTPRA